MILTGYRYEVVKSHGCLCPAGTLPIIERVILLLFVVFTFVVPFSPLIQFLHLSFSVSVLLKHHVFH